MKRISFNKQFLNEAGNDLKLGKIHTIRQNYEYWKKFEGQEVALFTWEGKPYRSKQIVFCVKKLISIQEIELTKREGILFFIANHEKQNIIDLAKNDGFFDSYGDIDHEGFINWFAKYNAGKMAILHFTEFRY